MQHDMTHTLSPGFFSRLKAQPADSLLALIGMYRADQRTNKIDVGVGVYKTSDGQTPVFKAIKTAERQLVEEQPSKGYLGPEGDIEFFNHLIPVVFGSGKTSHKKDENYGDRLSGLQTPGGTGALRLASELIASAKPGAKVFVGTPTWPNHIPILKAAGLQIVDCPYFDVASQSIRFDAFMSMLAGASGGDVVLLQASCHNPIGADMTTDQWLALAQQMAARGLLPLLDLAYQGLGQGLDEDAGGTRIIFDHVPEALLAYSCDKNFGLYRERTGALFALSESSAAAEITRSNLLSLARANWSMPPDHGAAAVRIILESKSLTMMWKTELEDMRCRITQMRSLLADLDPWFEPLRSQHGMFSMLPLTSQQVSILRKDHGIYMAPSGRINIAGLTENTVQPFAAAIAAVR
jgi:aromatic-amino-acid transaminase